MQTIYIQRALFYIFIQLITLWSIFQLLTTQKEQGLMALTGLGILMSVLFLYAYKTIKILKKMAREEKEEALGHA